MLREQVNNVRATSKNLCVYQDKCTLGSKRERVLPIFTYSALKLVALES